MKKYKKKFGPYRKPLEVTEYTEDDLKKMKKEARIKSLEKKLKEVNRELASIDEKGDEDFYETKEKFKILYEKHLKMENDDK